MMHVLEKTECLTALRVMESRCHQLGISFVHVDAAGKVIKKQAQVASRVDQCIIESSQIRSALMTATSKWNDQQIPKVTKVFNGCWLAPIRMVVRRRSVGYFVGVLIGREVADELLFEPIRIQAGLTAAMVAGEVSRRGSMAEIDAEQQTKNLRWMSDDLSAITRQQDNLECMTHQLGTSYEELSLIYRLAARMSVEHDAEAFIHAAIQDLMSVLGLRWMCLYISKQDMMVNELRDQLFPFGDPPVSLTSLKKLADALLERRDLEQLALIEDLNRVVPPLPINLDAMMLIAPIAVRSNISGVLFGAEKVSGLAASTVDAKLVTATAQHISLFLENASLYENLNETFMGTLQALVAAIDAKDTYTFGHSQRVAWLARKLASGAGLDPAIVQRIYVSALIHDIGKIGVPEAVLSKPGRLTEEEFDLIKTHPRIGAEILKDIPQMRDLIPGVLHHHERWDGHGYPNNLSGEEIPLFGRVICLADSFDAMSSTRTYRRPMSFKEVTQEIIRCAGTQFDPHLAAIFVDKIDLGHYFTMLENHQTQDSPLKNLLSA